MSYACVGHAKRQLRQLVLAVTMVVTMAVEPLVAADAGETVVPQVTEHCVAQVPMRCCR